MGNIYNTVNEIERILQSYNLSDLNYTFGTVYGPNEEHITDMNKVVDRIKDICKDLGLDEDYLRFVRNTSPLPSDFCPEFHYLYSFSVRKPGESTEQLTIFKGEQEDEMLFTISKIPLTTSEGTYDYYGGYRMTPPSFTEFRHTSYKNLVEAICLWLNNEE